jgi:hypothetical protein
LEWIKFYPEKEANCPFVVAVCPRGAPLAQWKVENREWRMGKINGKGKGHRND